MTGNISVHEHLLNTIITCLRNTNSNLVILDAGCGTLNFTKFLYENLDNQFTNRIDIYGYDIELFYDRDRILEIIKKNDLLAGNSMIDRISIVSMDNYHLPYDDNFFDFVISNQVVEHVTNLDEFYSEQKRVTKVGGYQIHCFPTKEIIIEPHLKIPFIHKLLNFRFAYSYLKFIYFLKGKTDSTFLKNRYDYLLTDTNYHKLNWHINKLKSLNLDVRSNFNIYFPFVKLLNILSVRKVFRYRSLGIFERLVSLFCSYFYSTIIIAIKN